MKGSKKENGEVSALILRRTEQIAALCLALNLVPTDSFAVHKELHVKGSCAPTEMRYTRWAKDANGNKGLVVLINENKVKFYTNPNKKFDLIRTVKD